MRSGTEPLASSGMTPLAQMEEVRALGESVATEGFERFRSQMQAQIRRSMGVTDGPRPACEDPEEAYFARTADFLGTTTFCSRAEAESAIERVRTVHRAVVGTAPDGRPYSAGDPDLLTWVHACEVGCFLSASLAYGPRAIDPADQDRYLSEMARVAVALGAVDVPRTVAELDDYFDAVRPELRLTREARTARNFVLRGVGRWPHELTTYGLLVAAAQGVLPGWARRQLHLLALPAGDRLAVRPTVLVLSRALRWIAAPPTHPRSR